MLRQETLTQPNTREILWPHPDPDQQIPGGEPRLTPLPACNKGPNLTREGQAGSPVFQSPWRLTSIPAPLPYPSPTTLLVETTRRTWTYTLTWQWQGSFSPFHRSVVTGNLVESQDTHPHPRVQRTFPITVSMEAIWEAVKSCVHPSQQERCQWRPSGGPERPSLSISN